jgi:hypothetical protein
MNLEGIEEVLLSPRSIELPREPKEILIDNNCFLINRRGCDVSVLDGHIELCKVLAHDSRCVFILPDIEKDQEACKVYIQRFMDEVKPLRFALIDLPFILENFTILIDHAELFAIPSNRVASAAFDLTHYHLLGSDPPVLARSWDDLQYDSSLPLAQAIQAHQEETRQRLGYYGRTAPTTVEGTT